MHFTRYMTNVVMPHVLHYWTFKSNDSYVFVWLCNIDRPRSLFSYLVVRLLCFFLPSTVIMSLEGEGAGRSTGRLLLCPHYVAARVSTLPLAAKEGLWSLSVTLNRDLFIAFFETWEGKLYISILQSLSGLYGSNMWKSCFYTLLYPRYTKYIEGI